MKLSVPPVTRYLNAQIAAGAQCVQLFDSWVGCLGPDDYRRYVLPHVKAIIQGITPGVPVINFAAGNPGYFTEDLARYRAVSAADISAIARTFLPLNERVELIVEPVK